MDGTTGGICQASYATRVPPHVKGNIHKMIVQPAVLYGMETVPVTSSHVKKTGSDRNEDDRAYGHAATR